MKTRLLWTFSGSSPLPPPAFQGAGEGFIYFNMDILGTMQRVIASYTGIVHKSVEATSPDGMLTVIIPEGTVIRDKNGQVGQSGMYR